MAADRAIQAHVPTAAALGQYYREMVEQGLEPFLIDRIVLDAAKRLHGNGIVLRGGDAA